MSSRYLVDPELLGVLDVFPKEQFSTATLAAIRAVQLPFAVDEGAVPKVSLTERSVPGPAGAPDVGVLIFAPREFHAPTPCIVHMHGGGYVVGSAASVAPSLCMLSAALECVIVSVNYRLAPETHFPGNIEDCYAALAWVFEQASELHVDPGCIGVKGESAGGGLAAALALLARDRAEFRIAFQHLDAPMLDDRTCLNKDPNPFAGEFIWTPQHNAFGWSSLLGVAPGSADISSYAAAARAEDLYGLPPTFIATGALDLFAEENIEYARRLMRAGVAVELHVYPGAIHGFGLAPQARVSSAAARISLAALRRFMFN
jgi:acetyl esterase/lipase